MTTKITVQDVLTNEVGNVLSGFCTIDQATQHVRNWLSSSTEDQQKTSLTQSLWYEQIPDAGASLRCSRSLFYTAYDLVWSPLKSKDLKVDSSSNVWYNFFNKPKSDTEYLLALAKATASGLLDINVAKGWWRAKLDHESVPLDIPEPEIASGKLTPEQVLPFWFEIMSCHTRSQVDENRINEWLSSLPYVSATILSEREKFLDKRKGDTEVDLIDVRSPKPLTRVLSDRQITTLKRLSIAVALERMSFTDAYKIVKLCLNRESLGAANVALMKEKANDYLISSALNKTGDFAYIWLELIKAYEIEHSEHVDGMTPLLNDTGAAPVVHARSRDQGKLKNLHKTVLGGSIPTVAKEEVPKTIEPSSKLVDVSLVSKDGHPIKETVPGASTVKVSPLPNLNPIIVLANLSYVMGTLNYGHWSKEEREHLKASLHKNWSNYLDQNVQELRDFFELPHGEAAITVANALPKLEFSSKGYLLPTELDFVRGWFEILRGNKKNLNGLDDTWLKCLVSPETIEKVKQEMNGAPQISSIPLGMKIPEFANQWQPQYQLTEYGLRILKSLCVTVAKGYLSNERGY